MTLPRRDSPAARPFVRKGTDTRGTGRGLPLPPRKDRNMAKLLDLAKPYSKAIAGAFAAAAAWAANRYAFSLPVGFEGFIQAAVPLVFVYLAPKNQERP